MIYLIKKLYNDPYILNKKFKEGVLWYEYTRSAEFKYFTLYLIYIYESEIVRESLTQSKIDLIFEFKKEILNNIWKIEKKIKWLEKNKKFKEDKYYLIKWEVDYADEFGYPIFSLYSWVDMNKLWKNLNYLSENDEIS